jgi:acid stress chaperone HdeB
MEKPIMKMFYAAIAASGLILGAQSALAAAENQLDVSELTCEQFTNYDDNNKGLIMMWFEGYYTEDDEDAVIDFGNMAGHLAKLLIACQADPKQKVLDLADDAME